MNPITPTCLTFRSLFRLVAGVCAAMLLLQSPTFARDPVERLRGALKSDPSNPQRRELVEATVKELKAINQLRRAYFLKEWPPETGKADPKLEIDSIRVALGRRLADAVRQAARDAAREPDATLQSSKQVAIARMIAELAEMDQPTERSPNGKYASTFLDVLIGGKAGAGLVDSPDIFVRQCALDALGKITPKPADARAALRKAIQGKDLGPRRLAAYALLDLVKNAHLLEFNDEVETIAEAVSAAVFGLRDPAEDESIRGYCLQTIQASAKILTDPNAEIRFEEVNEKPIVEARTRKILQAFHDANPRLVEALKSDPSVNIRLTAIEALSQIVSARLRIVTKLYEANDKIAGGRRLTRSEVLKTFQAPDPIGPLLGGPWEVVPGLLRKDEDPRVRRAAMALLELIAEDVEHALVSQKLDKAVTPETRRRFAHLMTPGLNDSDRFVRWSAARTVRYIAPEHLDEEIVVALGQMLIDRDHDLSMTAATTLESIAANRFATKAIRFLKSAITDREKDVEIRETALRTLVLIGGDAANGAFPELTSVLTDPEVRIRRLATESLGILGHPATRVVALAALDALKIALRDEDAQVRHNAAEAILSIVIPAN